MQRIEVEKMKTKIIILSIMVLSEFTLYAQFVWYEFSLYGAGGISEIRYDVNVGDRKTGFGGNAGLGYTFFFSPNWGLGSGAGISFLNSYTGVYIDYGLNDISDNWQSEKIIAYNSQSPTDFNYHSVLDFLISNPAVPEAIRER